MMESPAVESNEVGPLAPGTAARYSPASATKRMLPRLAQTST